jgi:hypothetical protein
VSSRQPVKTNQTREEEHHETLALFFLFKTKNKTADIVHYSV